jgi:HSP20 family protein
MARKAVKKAPEKKKEKEVAGVPAVPEPRHPLSDLREEIDRVVDRTFRGWPRFGGLLSDWDPFREMETVFGRHPFRRFPPTDIEEADKEYTVSIELPGLDAGDIDLSISDNTLTVKGEKKSERKEEEKGYRLMERSYGRFERTFRLPEEVNADKIDAAFDKGVLKINLPKRPEAQKKARKSAGRVRRG